MITVYHVKIIGHFKSLCISYRHVRGSIVRGQTLLGLLYFFLILVQKCVIKDWCYVIYYQHKLVTTRLKKGSAQRFRVANSARIFVPLLYYYIGNAKIKRTEIKRSLGAETERIQSQKIYWYRFTGTVYWYRFTVRDMSCRITIYNPLPIKILFSINPKHNPYPNPMVYTYI